MVLFHTLTIRGSDVASVDLEFRPWFSSLMEQMDGQMDGGFTISPIATDKRGYPHNIFLNSPQKHMLWVLIRSASVRRFL